MPKRKKPEELGGGSGTGSARLPLGNLQGGTMGNGLGSPLPPWEKVSLGPWRPRKLTFSHLGTKKEEDLKSWACWEPGPN